ncbi:uncharacterized protein LOC143831266 [Paroedura picta]|uniref:uncharacterized protein LOC143831266 n=1 Tax=Paroedura picta TaxID=143630 RepID=UPI00405640B9
MLYNYLIFLCIGVYASCKPIHSDRQTSISEIQKDFCAIEKQLDNHLQKSNVTSLWIPTKREGACAKFNLNTYIQLLNQLSVKITEENLAIRYGHMLDHLKILAGDWPEEDTGKNMACSTKQEDTLILRAKLSDFLLRTLPTHVCLHETACPHHSSENENCSRQLNGNSK